MKQLKLNRGFSIVDDDVFETVKNQKWCAARAKGKRNTYVIGTMRINGVKKTVMLHRLIMGFPANAVDHINGNSLDNRRANLRTVTDLQNKWNAKKSTNGSSKYKGVRFHKQRRKWTAQMSVNGKQVHLGIFDSEIEAAEAYDREAMRVRGKQYARVNGVLNAEVEIGQTDTPLLA